jgi:hypothetical protein
VKIRHLLDLVASGALEPEKRVEKMFEWRHTRLLETAKWALGLSAAFGVALIVPTVKDELHVGLVTRAGLIGLDLCLGVVGVIALFRGERVQAEYSAALNLLARLSTFRELIGRYRSK